MNKLLFLQQALQGVGPLKLLSIEIAIKILIMQIVVVLILVIITEINKTK
jgi:hypothetical protein